MPQFSFSACAQERLARFNSRSEDGFVSCFVLTKFRLRAEETVKDEQKEQFEDIENPRAEEILKQIIGCYGEAVGKRLKVRTLLIYFGRETAQNATIQIFPVSFFFSFLLLFGVFLFNNNTL